MTGITVHHKSRILSKNFCKRYTTHTCMEMMTHQYRGEYEDVQENNVIKSIWQRKWDEGMEAMWNTDTHRLNLSICVVHLDWNADLNSCPQNRACCAEGILKGVVHCVNFFLCIWCCCHWVVSADFLGAFSRHILSVSSGISMNTQEVRKQQAASALTFETFASNISANNCVGLWVMWLIRICIVSKISIILGFFLTSGHLALQAEWVGDFEIVVSSLWVECPFLNNDADETTGYWLKVWLKLTIGTRWHWHSHTLTFLLWLQFRFCLEHD